MASPRLRVMLTGVHRARLASTELTNRLWALASPVNLECVMLGRSRSSPSRLSAIARLSSEPAVPLGALQHRVRAGPRSRRVFTGSAQPTPAVDRQHAAARVERINIAAQPIDADGTGRQCGRVAQ